MRRLVLYIVLLNVISILVPATPGMAGTVIHEIGYTFYGSDPVKTMNTIKKHVLTRNGYVKSYSAGNIVIRIPAEYFKDIKTILLTQGYISDERMNNKDISAILADLPTRLTVKQVHLEKLYSLFGGSGVIETLEVEKEISRVVMEVEKIKGQIHYYRDRTAMGEMKIQFYRRTDASGTKGTAGIPINWINTLGVENLLRGY